MDINSVFERVKSDPNYAKQLIDAAAAAKAGPVDSPAWAELLKHFGTTPEQFAALECTSTDCVHKTSWTHFFPVVEALNALMKSK